MPETNDDIWITPATKDDVPAILGFIRELAEYERLSHQVVATEESLREHLFGARPAAEALIARIGDAAIGFALYFRNFSTFLCRPGIYLEDLYVQPAYRGRGAGRALLRQLARTAHERGYGRVEWAVLDWNAPAIAFYQTLGARPLDDWTVFRLTGDALCQVGGADDAAKSQAGGVDRHACRE